jgi:hypothetical protein
MARRPAPATKTDVQNVISAAKKAGAVKVEVRLGDAAAFTVYFHDENVSLEAPTKIVL